jgi:hypothetical protein
VGVGVQALLSQPLPDMLFTTAASMRIVGADQNCQTCHAHVRDQTGQACQICSQPSAACIHNASLPTVLLPSVCAPWVALQDP